MGDIVFFMQILVVAKIQKYFSPPLPFLGLSGSN
jgi:hypothetical protein